MEYKTKAYLGGVIMKDIRIEKVVGREILDSRGNPTV